jgi:hypothetical protein
MPSLSYRGLASCALSAAIVLSAVSCGPENPKPKSVLPAPPNAALAPPGGGFAEGAATTGVGHVQAVLRSLQDPDRRGRRVTFEFTEAEINEYLAYSLRVKPRPGILKAAVRLDPGDSFSVRTVLDLAGTLKGHSWILPEALKAVANTEPVLEMDVAFAAHDGYATFKLKALRGLGEALPADAAAWIVQAIGVHQPESYDTLRPIPLPFGIRRIWTGQGTVSGDTASPPAPPRQPSQPAQP